MLPTLLTIYQETLPHHHHQHQHQLEVPVVRPGSWQLSWVTVMFSLGNSLLELLMPLLTAPPPTHIGLRKVMFRSLILPKSLRAEGAELTPGKKTWLSRS